ncbi:ABC-type transport auxiliary lipoprotein family protein [Aquibium oceanicum]|uniref:ABC-type transport auxiliary lipoprotein family protein n=1 Tax=Aquibium oceanicum TaxID=1670800 RepID=UPI000DF815AB
MKSSRFVGVLVGVAALASGCAALPGGGPDPLDTYELTTPDLSVSGPANPRTQILIAEPNALKSLDGQDIVVKPAPASIQFLKGAQWGDRLPKLVQARLAEAFQRSDKFAGVGRPGDGLAIDYQIVVEIRSFEVRVQPGERAYVEFFVRILNDRNGVVRAARSFDAAVPVTGTGNDARVAAMDAAFGSVASAVVEWAVGVI